MPWAVESPSLAAALELPAKDVVLLNDLVATAFGLAELSPGDFLPLNEGVPDPRGNKAVIAAGTGLGEAVLLLGWPAPSRGPVGRRRGGFCST